MTFAVCALLTLALASSEAPLRLSVPPRLAAPPSPTVADPVAAPRKLGAFALRLAPAKPRSFDVFARSGATVDRKLSERLPRWLVVSSSRAIKLAATGYLANEMRKLSTYPAETRPAGPPRATARELAHLDRRHGGDDDQVSEWTLGAVVIGLGVLAAGAGLVFWEAEHPDQTMVDQRSAEGPTLTGLRVSLAGEGSWFALRGRWYAIRRRPS